MEQCFICKKVSPDVQYCEMCKHSFCDICRKNIPLRVRMALAEKSKPLWGRLAGL